MIFSGKASGPCEGLHSRNSSTDSQSPGLSGSSNSAVGVSESSTVTIQEFEYKNDSLDKTPVQGSSESQGMLRRKKRHRTPVQGSGCPTLQTQNSNKLDNVENHLLSDISCNQNIKRSVDSN